MSRAPEGISWERNNKGGKRALENGLLLRFDPHWLAFGPPLIVSERDIDAMVERLEHSVREVLRDL